MYVTYSYQVQVHCGRLKFSTELALSLYSGGMMARIGGKRRKVKVSECPRRKRVT